MYFFLLINDFLGMLLFRVGISSTGTGQETGEHVSTCSVCVVCIVVVLVINMSSVLIK